MAFWLVMTTVIDEATTTSISDIATIISTRVNPSSPVPRLRVRILIGDRPTRR